MEKSAISGDAMCHFVAKWVFRCRNYINTFASFPKYSPHARCVVSQSPIDIYIIIYEDWEMIIVCQKCKATPFAKFCSSQELGNLELITLSQHGIH